MFNIGDRVQVTNPGSCFRGHVGYIVGIINGADWGPFQVRLVDISGGSVRYDADDLRAI